MPSEKQDAQIKFRVSEAARKRFRIAAAMNDQSMTEFLKEACLDAAEKVIASFDTKELEGGKRRPKGGRSASD